MSDEEGYESDESLALCPTDEDSDLNEEDTRMIMNFMTANASLFEEENKIEPEAEQAYELQAQGFCSLFAMQQAETGEEAKAEGGAAAAAAPPNFFCEVCNVPCTSQQVFDDHVKGKKHRKATALAAEPKPAATNATSDADQPLQVHVAQEHDNSSAANAEDNNKSNKSGESATTAKAPSDNANAEVFVCEVCNVSCTGIASRDAHNKGKKHLKLLAEQNLKPATFHYWAKDIDYISPFADPSDAPEGEPDGKCELDAEAVGGAASEGQLEGKASGADATEGQPEGKASGTEGDVVVESAAEIGAEESKASESGSKEDHQPGESDFPPDNKKARKPVTSRDLLAQWLNPNFLTWHQGIIALFSRHNGVLPLSVLAGFKKLRDMEVTAPQIVADLPNYKGLEVKDDVLCLEYAKPLIERFRHVQNEMQAVHKRSMELIREEKFAEALQLLDDFQLPRVLHPYMFFNRALCHHKLGRPLLAIQDLKRAAWSSKSVQHHTIPDSAEFTLTIAKFQAALHEELRQWNEASKCYNRAGSADPGDSELGTRQAYCAKQKERAQSAPEQDLEDTKLVNLVIEGDHEALRASLMAHPENVNITELLDYGRPLLSIAAASGQLEIVKLLIEFKAPVNFLCLDNTFPLLLAAFGGHLDVVKTLIGAKAELDLRDEPSNMTALMSASEQGQTETVKFLIDAKASVDSVIRNGSTALHLAAQRNHAEVVAALLEAKADFNARDEFGDSPLDAAIKYRNNGVAVVLLAAGAESSAQPIIPSVNDELDESDYEEGDDENAD